MTSTKQSKKPSETSRSRPPTIRDVAEAAGVSYGTVSKSLNGTGQLRAETRALVRSTAERLGFRPNGLAQSLLRRRSFTVGLISTDRYGRFSIPVLEGIEDALGSASISVFLCSAADDPERERQHVESLLAKRVDGIIVTARRADPRPPLHCAHLGPPVLYAFARVNDPKAQCLLHDDFGGGKLAGDHLVGDIEQVERVDLRLLICHIPTLGQRIRPTGAAPRARRSQRHDRMFGGTVALNAGADRDPSDGSFRSPARAPSARKSRK